MPDYLSNDPSIAKGVEQSIVKDVDTFLPVEVGVHDVARFVSLPSKTALGAMICWIRSIVSGDIHFHLYQDSFWSVVNTTLPKFEALGIGPHAGQAH